MQNKRKYIVGGFTALIIAVVLSIVLGGGVAGASRLVTGHDIKDGSVKAKDLSPAVQRKLNQIKLVNSVQSQQIAALQHELFVLKQNPPKDGKDGKDGSVAGVQRNWVAKDGAVILSDHAVRVTNFRTPAGGSVEIQELNLPVQAGQVLTFTYELDSEAVYGAGSPRVFLEISGDFFNTFDADPSDAGVDNGDGTFTKSFTIPKNGRVGAAGVVVDSGVGSVKVSNLTVAGETLLFK